MYLHCIEVKESNVNVALQIEVQKTQMNYIESVAECLQEAREYAGWKPAIIYDEQIPVGFAMYGAFQNKEVEEIWLDRLIVDKKRQGKGYGKAAVKLLLEILLEECACKLIYLSVYDNNK